MEYYNTPLKFFILKRLKEVLSQRNKAISDSSQQLERVFARVVVLRNGRLIPKSFSPQNLFIQPKCFPIGAFKYIRN